MEINENILHFLLEHSNIGNIDEVLDCIENMTNKQLLSKHPYSITQNKDGRFSTYLPDCTKPANRRKVVKATREQLEKEIIKYYKEREAENSRENISLKELYPEWLDFKALHTASSAYIKTIDELWIKFYLNTDIINLPIRKLDKYTLDVWAHSLIRDRHLTKKKYYNTTVIMRQALDYAIDKKLINHNPFSDVRIDSKIFTPSKKKPNESQVFLIDEQPRIEAEAYKDFKQTQETACLAIPFAFQTGMRLGEIVALKWSDIGEEKPNCIHVQRMETTVYDKLDNGKWNSSKKEVIDRTKSYASNRNVYLTSTARDILDMIKTCNLQKGYENSGYIFLNNRGRMTSNALNYRIRKYCRLINISAKGMHKIRKTYISTLIDSDNININYIREQVGHEDERTTYRSYCFNRKSNDLTEIEMEKALTS